MVFFMPRSPFQPSSWFSHYVAVGVVAGKFSYGLDMKDVTNIEVLNTYEYHAQSELTEAMRQRWCRILEQVIPELPEMYPVETEAELLRMSLIYLMCTDLKPKHENFGESMKSLKLE